MKRQVEEEDADGEGWEKVKYGVAIPSVSINHYSTITLMLISIIFHRKNLRCSPRMLKSI